MEAKVQRSIYCHSETLNPNPLFHLKSCMHLQVGAMQETYPLVALNNVMHGQDEYAQDGTVWLENYL